MSNFKKRKTCHEANPEGYSGLTRAIYKGKEFEVQSVHFEEDLIAIIQDPNYEDEQLDWKRVESFDKVFNVKKNEKQN